MKSIALLTPFLLATPLLFASPTAAAEPALTPAAASNASATKVPDLSGVWAQKVVTSAVSKVSIIGEVISQSVAIKRVEIQQDGRELAVTSAPCHLELLTDQSMVKTQIPASYIAAMKHDTRTATLQGDAGQYTVDFPGKTTVLGARLEDPGDALPTKPSDPRVVDPDNDGHPGVTMRLSGFINSDLYLAQKNWDKMTGQLLPGDRIAGEVTWTADQVILDATSRMVGDSPDSSQHPDEKQSYFRMIRVAPDAQCADILEKQNELF